jgi:hypothetical protein
LQARRRRPAARAQRRHERAPARPRRPARNHLDPALRARLPPTPATTSAGPSTSTPAWPSTSPALAPRSYALRSPPAYASSWSPRSREVERPASRWAEMTSAPSPGEVTEIVSPGTLDRGCAGGAGERQPHASRH